MAGHGRGSPTPQQHPGVLVTGLRTKNIKSKATHKGITPQFAELGGLFQLPFQLQLIPTTEIVLSR